MVRTLVWCGENAGVVCNAGVVWWCGENAGVVRTLVGVERWCGVVVW